jgi:hypothetical protein
MSISEKRTGNCDNKFKKYKDIRKIISIIISYQKSISMPLIYYFL